jgi:hypothetical protein
MGTDMMNSLLDFTAFFQREDNSIVRGANYYKRGACGEFVMGLGLGLTLTLTLIYNHG